MEGDFIKINKWLLPLSWLYGIGVKFRNLCFETGILKSRSFDIPIISVGNITVGGTGKTPHVEYLTKILQEHFKVAILSRGYKRKTKGFVLANEKSTVADIGDDTGRLSQTDYLRRATAGWQITRTTDRQESSRYRHCHQMPHKPETDGVSCHHQSDEPIPLSETLLHNVGISELSIHQCRQTITTQPIDG